MPELRFERVEFHYPDGVPVFGGPCLTFALQGGCVALVGENGAGKTTLSKLLNGLLRPQAGRVFVDGIPVAERTIAQTAAIVGYAFQNPDDQLFQRTVRDEVGFGPKVLGRSRSQIEQAVSEALALCGLTGSSTSHPHDLGLPERKWVTIASALASDPPVLVLDEPSLGQDTVGRQRLRDVAHQMQAQGKLVLIISHDMDLVAETCETVLVLTRGRVAFLGRTAEAFSDTSLLHEAGLELPHSSRLATALGARGIAGEDAFLRWWASVPHS